MPCLFIIFIGREGSHFGCASVARPRTHTHSRSHTYDPHHFSLTFFVLILFLFHLLEPYFFMSKCLWLWLCVSVAAQTINENNNHVHVKYIHIGSHWWTLILIIISNVILIFRKHANDRKNSSKSTHTYIHRTQNLGFSSYSSSSLFCFSQFHVFPLLFGDFYEWYQSVSSQW